MVEPLDPLALPLRGSRLIEASAGTGKTWTLAALYVRLVIGHGGPPRLPDEILVMTFTRAATRELSDRIRRRLVQAAAVFRAEPGAAEDSFLQRLLAEVPDDAARKQAAWRLAQAAEAMDEAAVHTIDAWCQRMLREHAFDSGCLFDEVLEAREAEMRARAVRDYWRQQVYPLDDATLAGVLAQWRDVETLADDLKDLLDKPLPAEAGQGSLQEAVAHAHEQHAAWLAGLKAGWVERADAMLDWLDAQWQRKDCPIDKKKLGQANGTKWLQALKDWALDATAVVPKLGTGAERLTRDGVLATMKPGMSGAGPAPVPEVFREFADLVAALGNVPSVAPALRLHAAAAVRDRMQQLKARAGTFGFADQLDRLETALDESRRGGSALRLRERIVAQYPVALIDEFQDTSPVQLRIFDRLYRIADDDPARTLLLIGDPKQAIYKFRGADIYSYLLARRATAGRHHVLGTNHRSTKALVQAVNALFEGAEARPGEGAFLFRRPGSESELPFVAVGAQGRAEQLVGPQGPLAPITLAVDEPLRNVQDGRRLFAALCAERIVQWLNDPHVGFEEAGRPFRRLKPGDIAVLVRTGTEAEAVRREMRLRGLASVYLSDKDSVFQTPESADLLRLLQAVAAPRDMRLARAALATSLLGLSLPELVALASDDAAFDRQCERLGQLSQVWKGQGVLAMVRQALHAFGLPARWLAASDPQAAGERRLTQVLHLAELLQAASAEAAGEQALIRWLQQQRADAEQGLGGGDDRVLRLESDADLVQVVTVHKSKGLEYPVVFLPFPTHFREVVPPGRSARDAVLLLPAEGSGTAARELVLSPSPEQMAREEREQLREQLRLLYVALTRARHALWVGLSGVQAGQSHKYQWHRSAVGCLISGPEPLASAQRLVDLRALADRVPGIALETLPMAEALPMPPASKLRPRDGTPPLESPRIYTGRFDRLWSVSSYSALVRDVSAAAPQHGSPLPGAAVLDDEPEAAESEPGTQQAALQAWHRFPRGALAGNFLHDQLEWLAGERFALDSSPELQQRLLRRCERQGWGHRAEDVLHWLRTVCSTPLPPLGQALAGLDAPSPEMEFWFPSEGLQTQALDDLCRQHLLPGRPRPQLPERSLRGLLQGFIDLVFESGGRYWVLDHKSNALGTRDADYTASALDAAMLAHRYDVQASLYLLALHRLLKLRLANAYEPARHLGGAVYLFLRGIHGPAAGCCTLAAPLALIGALDAMLPAGATAAGRTRS